MSTIAEIDAETEFEELVEKKPWPQVVAKLARRQPLGAFGFCIVVIMLLLSVFAEFVTVYDPELNAFEVMLTPPGDQAITKNTTAVTPKSVGTIRRILRTT